QSRRVRLSDVVRAARQRGDSTRSTTFANRHSMGDAAARANPYRSCRHPSRGLPRSRAVRTLRAHVGKAFVTRRGTHPTELNDLSARAEHLPLRPAIARPSVLDVLVDNSLLVVLVALVASILVGLAGDVLVADSWMTLLGGREIFHHG